MYVIRMGRSIPDWDKLCPGDTGRFYYQKKKWLWLFNVCRGFNWADNIKCVEVTGKLGDLVSRNQEIQWFRPCLSVAYLRICKRHPYRNNTDLDIFNYTRPHCAKRGGLLGRLFLATGIPSGHVSLPISTPVKLLKSGPSRAASSSVNCVESPGLQATHTLPVVLYRSILSSPFTESIVRSTR